MFHKLLDEGEAGDNAGSAPSWYWKTQIRHPVWLSWSRFYYSHFEFKCNYTYWAKKESGRHTPFFNKYRPQFYFRTTDMAQVKLSWTPGTEMVMPGDNADR